MKEETGYRRKKGGECGENINGSCCITHTIGYVYRHLTTCLQTEKNESVFLQHLLLFSYQRHFDLLGYLLASASFWTH